MWFDIYKRAPGQYWWVAVGGNGEKLCHSEILSSKRACLNAIGVIKRDASTASVYDKTGETTGTTDQRRVA